MHSCSPTAAKTKKLAISDKLIFLEIKRQKYSGFLLHHHDNCILKNQLAILEAQLKVWEQSRENFTN
jgi:hypothetical protein